jgi:O-antigen ligase
LNANARIGNPLRGGLVLDSADQSQGIVPILTAGVLFVVFGRLAEVLVMVIGNSLRIAMISLVVASVATVLSGGLKRAFGNPAGFLYLLFTGWSLLAIPFSVYRRGAVETVKDSWLPTLLIFLCVAGGLKTLQDCRRTLYAISLAIAIITLLAFVKRVELMGRLFIEGISLGNANYVALHILFGFAFLIYIVFHFTPFSWQGFLAGVTAAFAGWAVLLTGSRGGLLGLAFGALAALAVLPSVARWRLAAAGLATMILVIPFLPQGLRDRYLTVYGGERMVEAEDEEGLRLELESAMLSGEARRGHLMESIQKTFENPLFGVGPGQFIVASSTAAEQAGLRGNWRVTHNSYTEVSSETGIPGFLLYMAPVVIALRTLYRNIKRLRDHPAARDAWLLGVCLLVSLSTTMVTTFFASVAYLSYIPVLVGLSLVFGRACEAEWQVATLTATQPPAPTPKWPGLRLSAKLPAPAPKPTFTPLGSAGERSRLRREKPDGGASRPQGS